MGDAFITRRGGARPVKRVTGTFTTSSSGTATVNFGFLPDLIYIDMGSEAEGGTTYYYSMALAVKENNRTSDMVVTSWTDNDKEYPIWDFTFDVSNTGFSVEVVQYDYSFEYAALSRKTFTYTAVKYS